VLKLANLKNEKRLLFAAELSSERKAIQLAQRLANWMGKTSKARPEATIVVTDKDGKEICRAVVPFSR
jgi:hypothetical protein